jgi:hypothetical protein
MPIKVVTTDKGIAREIIRVGLQLPRNTRITRIARIPP